MDCPPGADPYSYYCINCDLSIAKDEGNICPNCLEEMEREWHCITISYVEGRKTE
jgi:predicted amidophosphoribosyltransferase